MRIKHSNKSIFLDRDGTLIKAIKKGKTKYRPPYSKKELKIYNDIKFLKFFSKNYFLIICTNQPDIKRGLQTKTFDNFINKKIKQILPIEEIFSCECLKTEKNCNCYKPKTTMILKAKKKYKINLKKSYVIGDTWRDISLGQNTGCKTILVDRGQNEIIMKKNKFKPDFIIKNLKNLKKIIN
ncbi:HAD-IIIA family hydrolase [Pelagibacterales bacterium SAG-MED03]|nr:HAD-IIIA family hydrolase [Pelagibacterales bacterium SAG-MED03]|tara:strand:- start:251 stop:796 length:546 start_codon:yes stop_codon:yes gene_type:complete